LIIGLSHEFEEKVGTRNNLFFLHEYQNYLYTHLREGFVAQVQETNQIFLLLILVLCCASCTELPTPW